LRTLSTGRGADWRRGDLAQREGGVKVNQNWKGGLRCPRCDTSIADGDVWIAESVVVVLCRGCGLGGELDTDPDGIVSCAEAPSEEGSSCVRPSNPPCGVVAIAQTTGRSAGCFDREHPACAPVVCITRANSAWVRPRPGIVSFALGPPDGTT